MSPAILRCQELCEVPFSARRRRVRLCQRISTRSLAYMSIACKRIPAYESKSKENPITRSHHHKKKKKKGRENPKKEQKCPNSSPVSGILNFLGGSEERILLPPIEGRRHSILLEIEARFGSRRSPNRRDGFLFPRRWYHQQYIA